MKCRRDGACYFLADELKRCRAYGAEIPGGIMFKRETKMTAKFDAAQIMI
jgi:hypothetical protein